MGPGDIFGEIALFDPGPRTATATATQQSQVLRVRSVDVQAQLAQHPELAIDMIRLAGRRMRYMGQQLNEQVLSGQFHRGWHASSCIWLIAATMAAEPLTCPRPNLPSLLVPRARRFPRQLRPGNDRVCLNQHVAACVSMICRRSKSSQILISSDYCVGVIFVTDNIRESCECSRGYRP